MKYFFSNLPRISGMTRLVGYGQPDRPLKTIGPVPWALPEREASAKGLWAADRPPLETAIGRKGR